MAAITDVIAYGASSTSPSIAPTDLKRLLVNSNGALYTATLIFNSAGFEDQRNANVFKSVVATAAGDTAVWTPASGKKFRLMGYAVSVCGTLAVLGVEVIQLRDSATVIARHAAAVGATVLGDTQFGQVYNGNGQLSALVNNVLNVNLGTAMTAGGVYVNAWGTEE